jgi:hypothetical protein
LRDTEPESALKLDPTHDDVRLSERYVNGKRARQSSAPTFTRRSLPATCDAYKISPLIPKKHRALPVVNSRLKDTRRIESLGRIKWIASADL